MNTLKICKECGRVLINGKWMRFKFTGGADEVKFESVECNSCARISDFITVIPKGVA